MSTKPKKSGKVPTTGIRYTDAQKKEIVAYVDKYNATNGRGGQSAASAKYKVTPLTISGWLKSAGVKTPKAKTVAKKTVAKKGGKARKGVRYPQDFKNEVVDFVESYNATHGRGGQNQAASKFKLSVLTVSAWLTAAGAKKPGRKKTTAKVAKLSKKPTKKSAKKAAKAVGGDLAAFKAELLNLIKQF